MRIPPTPKTMTIQLDSWNLTTASISLLVSAREASRSASTFFMLSLATLYQVNATCGMAPEPTCRQRTKLLDMRGCGHAHLPHASSRYKYLALKPAVAVVQRVGCLHNPLVDSGQNSPGHDAVDMRISHTQATDKNTLRKNLPWPWRQL